MTRVQSDRTIRVGGLLAALVSVSYGVALVSYLVIPDVALDSAAAGPYLMGVMENRSWFTVLWGSQAVAALFALGVVPAVWLHLRGTESGWLPWLSVLGLFGFALTALDYSRVVSMVPFEANIYANADEAVRRMVAGDFFHLGASGDFMKMAPIGVWLSGVSAIGRGGGLISPGLASLGIAVGVAHLGLGVEDLFANGWIEPASAVVAGLGGAAWYAWLGVTLTRDTTDPAANPRGGV